jgi:hypothetical protein
MAIEFTEITENSPDFTVSYTAVLGEILVKLDGMEKRLDHADELAHDMSRKIDAMHEELEAARPLIERWQHSKIRGLLNGRQPWQT